MSEDMEYELAVEDEDDTYEETMEEMVIGHFEVATHTETNEIVLALRRLAREVKENEERRKMKELAEAKRKGDELRRKEEEREAESLRLREQLAIATAEIESTKKALIAEWESLARVEIENTKEELKTERERLARLAADWEEAHKREENIIPSLSKISEAQLPIDVTPTHPGEILEQLQRNLKNEREEKPDAVRAHWFAHRYVPKNHRSNEENDQMSANSSKRQQAEADLTAEPENRRLEPTLPPAEDVDPLDFIVKALAAKELLEIPYDDLEKICAVGRGNYGTVYKANCQRHEFSVVVVKEYTDPRDMIHDVQVFMILGKHKNLVNFHGVTKNLETQQYDIVQEYAERGNMHDFWDFEEATSLPWAVKINMACDLAHSLEHIHKKKILHRGLDCENVLIRKDGSLALTGFSLSGLSGSLYDAARAKEQLTYYGIAQVDLEKSDIYSLGILLWEVLHGKRAFEDNYDPSLLEDIMNGCRPGMDGKGGNLIIEGTPPDYIRLYEACWHTDPLVWPTIPNIVDRLETLRSLTKEDWGFNWEQLDSVWIGWEKEKLTKAEISKKLEQLNVHVIPYNSISFRQKNFRRGGFADVHIGDWNKNPVAVKAQTKNPSDIIREVTFLLDMKGHPRIVEFYGISRDAESNHYMIMRLANMSLHEYAHCNEYYSMPWSIKFNIAKGIAEGLKFLHAKCIIHCDVHSGNVLIDHDGTPRLTDFGLSRTFDEAQRPEFRIKIYGRLGYLAPELLKKPPPPYSYAQDIFGFGVLCWEIASSDYPNHRTKAINPARFQPMIRCPSVQYQKIYQQCGSDEPDKRPGLNNIIEELTSIQKELDKSNRMPESVEQRMQDLISTSDSSFQISTIDNHEENDTRHLMRSSIIRKNEQPLNLALVGTSAESYDTRRTSMTSVPVVISKPAVNSIQGQGQSSHTLAKISKSPLHVTINIPEAEHDTTAEAGSSIRPSISRGLEGGIDLGEANQSGPPSQPNGETQERPIPNQDITEVEGDEGLTLDGLGIVPILRESSISRQSTIAQCNLQRANPILAINILDIIELATTFEGKIGPKLPPSRDMLYRKYSHTPWESIIRFKYRTKGDNGENTLLIRSDHHILLAVVEARIRKEVARLLSSYVVPIPDEAGYKYLAPSVRENIEGKNKLTEVVLVNKLLHSQLQKEDIYLNAKDKKKKKRAGERLPEPLIMNTVDGQNLPSEFMIDVSAVFPAIVETYPTYAQKILQRVGYTKVSLMTKARKATRDNSNTIEFVELKLISNFPCKYGRTSFKQALGLTWWKTPVRKFFYENAVSQSKTVHVVCIVPLRNICLFEGRDSNWYGDKPIRSNTNWEPYSIFTRIVQSDNAQDIFEVDFWDVVLEFKWRSYAAERFLLVWLFEIIYILLFAICTSPYIPPDQPLVGWSFAFQITSIIMASLLLVQNARQCYHFGWRKYLFNVYNYLNVATYALAIAICSVNILQGLRVNNQLTALTTLLLWLRFSLQLRVFRPVGIFINVLIGSFQGLGPFLAFMLMIILGFAHANWILLAWVTTNGPNVFMDFTSSLKNTYWGITGDISGLKAFDGYSSITDVFRVLFTFIGTIFLLNFMIAVLTDQYKIALEKSGASFRLQLAQIIAEIETFWMTPSERKNEKFFPKDIYFETNPEDVDEWMDRYGDIEFD